MTLQFDRAFLSIFIWGLVMPQKDEVGRGRVAVEARRIQFGQLRQKGNIGDLIVEVH